MKDTDRIREIGESIEGGIWKELILNVIDSEAFSIWPGSSKPGQHHYHDGGLAKHTREVIELSLMNRKYLEEQGYTSSISVVFLSALYHDIGKIYDYQKVDGVWTGTEHKRKIHHISRSALVWHHACMSMNPPNPGVCYDVLHCILSHHGQRAWGSPVAPKTREAWILHLSDGMSARGNDADSFDPYKG